MPTPGSLDRTLNIVLSGVKTTFNIASPTCPNIGTIEANAIKPALPTAITPFLNVSDLFQSKTIPPIKSVTADTIKPIGFNFIAVLSAICCPVRSLVTVACTPVITDQALVRAICTFIAAL